MPELKPMTRSCFCGACKRFFRGIGAFASHQTLDKEGRTVCHDPASRGMVLSKDGWWSRRTPDVAQRGQDSSAESPAQDVGAVQGRLI